MARRNLLTLMASSIATGFKSVVPVTSLPAAMVGPGSWFGAIRESFSGAWQSNVTIDPQHSLLASSAVYACITLIATDISKLRIRLMALQQGVWQETASAAFSPVLRKPNHYQTRNQFMNQWVSSKLIHGNTYVLKERDQRGIVVALYVLDSRLVKPLVTDIGDVYYQIGRDRITGSQESVTVPASEIIHDRGVCFFHPLIGIGPLYAAALSTTQGNRIQQNSAKFFENMSRPSGMLTAPNVISDETAIRLKSEFEKNFSGVNVGRLMVAGDGLEYKDLGTIPAQQSQLIDQLRWTVEDIARAFHIPLHKIASDTGLKFSNMAAMNQDYYNQTLQGLIEDIESLLDEGLGLTGGPQQLGVALDLDGLLRMDPVQRAERNEKNVKAAIWSIDEARATDDMPPLPSGAGKEPFMQQQNFPLSVLLQQPPPGSVPAAPVVPALPAPTDPAADPNAKAVTEAVTAWRAAADMVEAAEAQRVLREQEADRRRADDTAILARALDQIETERKALAAVAEAERTARAAQEDEAQAEVEDLAALLIAKFTAATNVG